MVTDGGTVAIPGSPSAGNRMLLYGTWKDFAITVANPSGWTPIGTVFADGAVNAGNGLGSVDVMAWYRDWQSGDAAPAIDYSAAPTEGLWVIQLWQKDAGDVWDTPLTATGAIAAADPFTVNASSTLTILDGSIVECLIGLRDDSSTLARATDAIDDTGGLVTWNGNYVESPATHISSSTGNDMAADLGHRLVTTGAAGVTLHADGDPAAAETGGAKFIVIRAAPAATSVQPSPVALAPAVTSPTISLAYSVAPSPIGLAPAIPAPTISIDQAVAPSPVALAPAVSAPAVENVLSVLPSPVALSSAIPAPTIETPLGLSPSPVALASAVPAPTLETELGISPSPVTASPIVPAPAVTTELGLSPAPIALSATVPTPTVESVLTVAPTPVVVVLAVPTPTLGLELALSPDPVAAQAAVPSPTIGLVLALSPGPVAAMTAVPLPDIEVAGGERLVQPAPVAMAPTVPAPSLEFALSLSPTPVAATLFVPAPLLGLILALSPAPVRIDTAVPSPSVGAAVLTLSPAPVGLTPRVPAPTVGVAATGPPVAATVTLDGRWGGSVQLHPTISGEVTRHD
jgi:hypothetical protein